MRPVGFVFALIFLGSLHAVAASDLSIVGTRLGMTEEEIKRALPKEIQAKAEKMEDIDAVSYGSYCRWPARNSPPCVTFHAILSGRPFSKAVSIRLDQRFEHPVTLAKLSDRLIEAYGDPTLKHFSGTIFPDPTWVWSPDDLAVMLQKYEGRIPESTNPGQVNLKAPMLRAILGVEGNLVYGLRLLLHDPLGMAKLDEQREKSRIDADRRAADDAASKIRLK